MTPLFKSMLKPASVVLFSLFVTCAAAVPVLAQNDIVYDWDTHSLMSCPSELNSSKSANLVVKNINDILFSYRFKLHTVQRPIDDWANLSQQIERTARAAPAPAPGDKAQSLATCPASSFDEARAVLAEIRNNIENDPALPLGYQKAGQNTPVKLRASLAAWRRIEAGFSELREKVRQLQTPCAGTNELDSFMNEYHRLERDILALEALVNTGHEFRRHLTLEPNTDYSLEAVESFGTTVIFDTQTTPLEECKPASGQLTLSAGVLFSSIADRSYVSRKFPGMTENVLAVEGNSSFRPEGVLLLNYLIPHANWAGGTAGLALSAGPVIRFGSKSDLATLGFFSGLSFNLYRRLYITPGFHFGEFADFPVGFHEGQAIPANFGELTPVKRWTARFAIAISFRTASFAAPGGSGNSEASPAKTVQNRNVEGANEADHASALPSAIRFDGRASARDFTPVRYGTDREDAHPSPTRIASLRSVETPNGSQVTIVGDSALTNYTTYTNDNVLYIILPHTTSISRRQGDLKGHSFGNARLEQSEENLTISFVVPRGTSAHLTQKFNCLEVSFRTSKDSVSTQTAR
jgi:hypothetical protein